MTVQTLTSPSGDELVVLTRREYEDLIDARDHAAAMREIEAGTMPMLDDAELDDYLAAATPLAFWRKRRGLSQAALASEAGLSQGYVAQMETGHRTGDIETHAKLARVLHVRVDDLIAD